MRGNAVILTPDVEGLQGRNELFTGALEAVLAVVVAAANAGTDPPADGALGGDVLGAVAAAVVTTAAGLTVDTTAGATLDPAAGAGGSDTGAGGPI